MGQYRFIMDKGENVDKFIKRAMRPIKVWQMMRFLYQRQKRWDFVNSRLSYVKLGNYTYQDCLRAVAQSDVEEGEIGRMSMMLCSRCNRGNMTLDEALRIVAERERCYDRMKRG